MDNVMFMSRANFMNTRRKPDDGRAFISISNNEEERQEILYWLESLGNTNPCFAMAFPDNDDAMSVVQARHLFLFIKRNEDRRFIVHCEMGVSRSGAVAKFINDYLGYDDVVFRHYDMYNRRVYRQLQAQAGDSFESYKAYLAEQEAQDRMQ